MVGLPVLQQSTARLCRLHGTGTKTRRQSWERGWRTSGTINVSAIQAYPLQTQKQSNGVRHVPLPHSYTQKRRAPTSNGQDCVAVTIHEVKYLAVFTERSANLTNTEWLAHGGWGVFSANKARTNRGGHLVGLPVTSYRAEVRAMVDAVLRAGTLVCIISDIAAAVINLSAIFDVAGVTRTWNINDECEDY